MRRSNANASLASRTTPRGEPAEPLRNRWAAITGANVSPDTVASRAFRPRTPEYPNAAPCLACPCTSMMVSSMSTSTSPVSPAAPSNPVRDANAVRNRDATASTWRTCPKVKARRKDPNVDGAYAEANTFPIPPWRSRAMSSILSAPAAIPATSEDSFNPALAPLSVGTLTCLSPSSRNPALRAKPINGTSPAAATRLGSSNEADATGRV